MFDQWAIPFREVRIDQDDAAMQEFTRVTNGARTVPQILVAGRLIGGFSELMQFEREGGLDQLKGSAHI